MNKTPMVSKNCIANWKNNAIQFPRLIAELEASGVFTTNVIKELQSSMDLGKGEICEIIDRAQTIWDAIKAQT
jgi:hypothetical protein